MTVYRVHLLYTHTHIYVYMQWAFEEQFPISHNHMAFPYVYMFVFLDGALVQATDSNNRYYLILLLPSDKKRVLTDRNFMKKKHTSWTRSKKQFSQYPTPLLSTTRHKKMGCQFTHYIIPLS